MSYAFRKQNEAPEADESREGVEPPDATPSACLVRVPRAGGFFSDVVWVEREEDCPDAGQAR